MNLNPLPDDKFYTLPSLKSLQTIISNLRKMEESYPNRWKTLWVKEKLLITSNFSFSHSVFKRLVSQGRQKVSLSGNGLTLARLIFELLPFVVFFILEFCTEHISKTILAMAMKFHGRLQLGVRRGYLATICRSCSHNVFNRLFLKGH